MATRQRPSSDEPISVRAAHHQVGLSPMEPSSSRVVVEEKDIMVMGGADDREPMDLGLDRSIDLAPQPHHPPPTSLDPPPPPTIAGLPDRSDEHPDRSVLSSFNAIVCLHDWAFVHSFLEL